MGGWSIVFPGQQVSFISSGNLSADQFRCVKVGTAAHTVVKCTAATDKCCGILQNTPSTGGGDGATVMIGGISKALKDSTAAAIERGDYLTPTTGGGVHQSTGGASDFIIGMAMSSASASSTGYVSVLITLRGPGSTDT